jgi:hypothetical protein
MDIGEILSSQGPKLLETLEGVGFNAEQAQQFLPEAGQQIASALSGGGLGDLLSGNSVGGLLESIDVAGLSSRLGIDGGLVGSGLNAIVPQIIDGLKGDAGGVLGGLGSKLLG